MSFYSGSSSSEYNIAEFDVINWLSVYLSERENKEIVIKHKHCYSYENNKSFELDGFGSNFAI